MRNWKTVIDGFAKGESIDEIAERIKNMFVSAEEFRAQMIAKTESIRYNAGATEQAFKDSGIVERKEWLVNPGACEYCQTMPGKSVPLGESFFKEGDSVNGVDGGKLSLDYEQVEHPPLHTNSVWDGTAYVFTPKGNKRLKEVKVNDLVLTHTGKFKKF